MPGEVRSAGGPGSPCCLFWPLAGVQSQRADTQQGGVWQQVTGNPLVQYVALAATVSAQLVDHSVVLSFRCFISICTGAPCQLGPLWCRFPHDSCYINASQLVTCAGDECCLIKSLHQLVDCILRSWIDFRMQGLVSTESWPRSCEQLTGLKPRSIVTPAIGLAAASSMHLHLHSLTAIIQVIAIRNF